MNRNLILKTLGLILLCEAAAMVPSLLLCTYYGEGDARAFLWSIFATGAVGALLATRKVYSKNVGYREGFAIAASGWSMAVAFGALPFIFAGILNPVDAFFEAMSGFTTTGASVIRDVEVLGKGIIFWRSLTQWLGGMGIIVLTLALIPSLKIAGMQLYRAEVPGHTKSKVLPRIAQTTRELYKVYLIITVAEIVCLKLAGMNLFDSFIHTFSSVATGGFSNKNTSIGFYDSLLIESIVIFFMVICGINFALHFYTLRGNFKPLWKDTEVKVFLGIIIAATILIGVNLVWQMGLSPGSALRDSLFTVSAIITGTGYATADFEKWPDFNKVLLFTLMLVGGCACSTTGALKVGRLVILYKTVTRQFTKLIHPQAVVPVRVGRESVSQDVVENIQTFFFLYILLLVGATAYISLLGFDLVSSASAAAASLGNVGPGFGLVGPMANYATLPDSGKVLLAFCMLVGRLEIYSLLLLFSLKFWRN